MIVVITTDGQENSSKEYSKNQIKEMIEHQQLKYNWHFTFLRATEDAFAEAGGMGIAAAGAANFASSKVADAYLATAAKVSRMRRQSGGGESVKNEFTEDERRSME